MKQTTTTRLHDLFARTRYSKKRIAVLAISVVMVATAFMPLVRSRIVHAESYQDRINAIQEQIQSFESEASRLRQEASSLQGTINEINTEKARIQALIDLSQAKLDNVLLQIDQNQTKLTNQQMALTQTIGDMATESQTTAIEVLASTNTVGDFISMQEYRDSIQESIQESIKEINRIKADLARQKTEVETILAEQRSQHQALANKQAEQAELLAITQGQEANFLGAVEGLRAQEAQAQSDLARSLQARSYAASPAGRVEAGSVVGFVGNTGFSTGPHLHLEVRVGGAHTNPSAYMDVEPVANGYVSQAYGVVDAWTRASYIGGVHTGIDYASPEGEPIRAIRSGDLFCQWSDGYGFAAFVEHDDGSVALYGHMSRGCGQ